MPILSDDPALMARIAASPAAPKLAEPNGVPHAGVLREHFFEGVVPHYGEAPVERWWVLRGHAPRSQYDAMLLALASGGPHALPHGLATVALSGSRFRGQRGRSWTALEGNLHLCVHHHLGTLGGGEQAALSILPALATAEAIEALGGPPVGFKWVNDLVVAGAKVGGVLSAVQWREGRALALTCGVGVNVVQAPELPPDQSALPAAALATTAPKFAEPQALWALLARVVGRIEAQLATLTREGPAALLAGYRQRAIFIGREVAILPVDPGASESIARGRVLALRDDLSLELEGVREPIRHGRMRLL